MAASKHVSETPATQMLKKHKVAYTEHIYDYIEHGGTAEAARQLGIDSHAVVKTLILEDEHAKPHVMLMHGDCEVSMKNLARQASVKKMQPCQAAVAPRHSGYQIGGTSPFGTRKRMPVWVEQSVLDLPQIYINGGRRGYLLGVDPQVLVTLLQANSVNVANDGRSA